MTISGVKVAISAKEKSSTGKQQMAIKQKMQFSHSKNTLLQYNILPVIENSR